MQSILNDPDQRPIDWRAVQQLLQSGQYEQAAGLLHAVQADGQATNVLSATAAAAVGLICQACSRLHADAEWHSQAREEAERREDQLKGYAQAILDWVGRDALAESALPAAQPPAAAPLAGQPGLRVGLRRLLQNIKDAFIFRREIPPALETPTSQDISPPVSEVAAETAVEETTVAETAAEEAVIEETIAQETAIAETGVEETGAPPVVAPDGQSEPQSEQPAALAPLETPARPPQQEPFTLVIYFFGSFRIYQQNQLIEAWNGLRGQALLKYLAAHRTTPIAKDVLMDVFWRDADPEAARRNLHQAVYSLRQTLRRSQPATQLIMFENNQYLLNPALQIWVDVEEFEAHVQTGRRMEATGESAAAMAAYGAADGLYQGDFLAEDLYDEWPRLRRQQLQTAYLEIANRLSEYYRQLAEFGPAIGICQKMLTFDRCAEDAHRRLMHCYLAQGQRHLAIRQYQACVQALAEELDVPPSPETGSLYEQITASS
jgi:DNA-binding SARP family transcriptional activator